MSVVEAAPARMLTEPLSWDEICRRYPDQWVCFVELDWPSRPFEFRSARVVGFGPTREAAWAQGQAWSDEYDVGPVWFTREIEVRIPARYFQRSPR